MPTKRRRRASKRQVVDPLQRAIFDIGNPRGYIVGQNPTGAGPRFDSEDHVRECWQEVREEIISDRWEESHPGDPTLWLDRHGMPTAFWIYDAPDIDAQRRGSRTGAVARQDAGLAVSGVSPCVPV